MMLMNIKRFSIFLFVVMFFFAGARAVRSEYLSTIDVSKYPQKVQDVYNNTYSQKCVMCHNLARSINTNYALPSEWEDMVKRMSHMPGSNISSADAKEIFEFLVYDSGIRKKALLDEKLMTATPAEKAAAQAEIKAILDKYGH